MISQGVHQFQEEPDRVGRRDPSAEKTPSANSSALAGNPSDRLADTAVDQRFRISLGQPRCGRLLPFTSAWVGLSSKCDQHHQSAVAWYRFVTRTRSTIISTEAVLLEWLNAMSDISTRRMGGRELSERPGRHTYRGRPAPSRTSELCNALRRLT